MTTKAAISVGDTDVRNLPIKPLTVVSIDPGERSGISLWVKGGLIEAYTLNENFLRKECMRVKEMYFLDYIVIEEFRLRSNKAKSLSNQILYTAQLIGKLQEWFSGIPIVYQSPGIANGKRFFTVDKLKALGLRWNSIHERDAITHGIYALTFNKEIK